MDSDAYYPFRRNVNYYVQQGSTTIINTIQININFTTQKIPVIGQFRVDRIKGYMPSNVQLDFCNENLIVISIVMAQCLLILDKYVN
jgi:hypothetical protein